MPTQCLIITVQKKKIVFDGCLLKSLSGKIGCVMIRKINPNLYN